MSMVQVYQHPQFDDVRVNVPDGDGQRWRDQGWRRVSKDKAPAPRQEPGTVVLVSELERLQREKEERDSAAAQEAAEQRKAQASVGVDGLFQKLILARQRLCRRICPAACVRQLRPAMGAVKQTDAQLVLQLLNLL